MKKIEKFILLLFFNSIIFAFGISYSGEIKPTLKYQPSDGTLLELPFRISKINIDLYHKNLELQSSFALETRWEDLDETKFQLRELYIHWYPKFGEIKIGKIIHAWGYADQNNPTNNLSAFNYYYLFETGIDRQIGSLSGSVSINLGNLNVEGIIIGEYIPHALVKNEPDFPLQTPNILSVWIDEIDNPIEFGVRLKHNILGVDYSLSYFSGYDKMLSKHHWDIYTFESPGFFSYRNTNVFGFDAVGFWNDFTFRTEFSYFFTEHDYHNKSILNPTKNKAEYLQYVLQIEYSTSNDINFMLQYLGKYINYVSDKPIFKPGLGIPFLTEIDNLILLSGSKNFFDDNYELKLSSLYDIDNKGTMFAITNLYLINEHFEFELNYMQFFADKGFFSLMENFSHLSFGLKYNF